MEKFTYGFIFDEFDVDLAGLFTVTCWFGQTSKINKNTTQLSLNLDFRQFTPIPTVFSRLNYSDNYLQVTISDGTFWWISSVFTVQNCSCWFVSTGALGIDWYRQATADISATQFFSWSSSDLQSLQFGNLDSNTDKSYIGFFFAVVVLLLANAAMVPKPFRSAKIVTSLVSLSMNSDTRWDFGTNIPGQTEMIGLPFSEKILWLVSFWGFPNEAAAVDSQFQLQLQSFGPSDLCLSPMH